MDIIQVGLGDFGLGWFKNTLLDSEEVRIVGVVDRNTELLRKAKEIGNLEETALFTDLEEALNSVKADFILNVTPPKSHKEINLLAFKRGIPVLSEKPICESMVDALEILKASKESAVPIMIAENYRYFDAVRKAREIIESGEIGELNTVDIDFFRNHHMENYHKYLKHPLLLDVTIHHMDMLRFLTGTEVVEVFARSWNPEWSWYKENSNISMMLELENNVKVSYRGSLSAPQSSTGWLANWRIEGSKGVMELSESEMHITLKDSEKIISVQEGISSSEKVLNEFIRSLKEKRAGETDINDNIKTFNIVQAAIKSIENNSIVKIRECEAAI